MTVLVLRRIDSNVMFNKLLMSLGKTKVSPYLIHHQFPLAIYDALYLLYYVVDHGIIGTFMRSFKEPEPLWYRLTYPYVLWPLKWVFMSCTIFMVVAISAERHRAICSPLTHRPKFWPYVFMVTFSACKFSNVSILTIALKCVSLPQALSISPNISNSNSSSTTTTTRWTM